ncbi:hypothetical protein C2E23DRAFT_210497 [Lenzites betulinus]|nr:hypothetical protein C2E23DRAFT_210497 [Lenzites betulinus]
MFLTMSSSETSSFDANDTVLHGVVNTDCMSPESQLALHVVSGECLNCDAVRCKAYISGFQPDEYRSHVLHCIQDGMANSTDETLDRVAVLLGMPNPDIIRSISERLDSAVRTCSPQNDATVLNEIERMTLAAVRAVADAHAIEYHSTTRREELRVLIAAHISNGSCFRRTDGRSGPACQTVVDSTEGEPGSSGVDDVQIRILTHLLPRLSSSALKRVMRVNSVRFSEGTGVASLRQRRGNINLGSR